MNVVYALQDLPRSIFLAGPTPRDPLVGSWRPEALEILERLGFTGSVFVPESEDWLAHDNYDRQIEWEWEGLDRASTIVFWIPRDLVTMPAFTTNVEFGYMVASKKILLGYPPGARKTNYLKALAERHGVPVFHTLEDILEEAARRA